MNTCFLLLSSPRCGSTMLRLALSDHPNVHMHLLYNNGGNKPTSHDEWRHFQLKEESRITHRGTFMFRHDRAWIETYSPIASQFWETMAVSHDHVICLRRNNLLRQFLSHCTAEIIPEGREVRFARNGRPPPIWIAIDRLDQFIQYMNQLFQIDCYFPNRLNITYETLTSQWSRTLATIQSYLGLPAVDVKPRTVRQETRPLLSAIANYGEVAHWLHNHSHSEWLEEI